MKIHHEHEWDLTPGEAREVQLELADHVREEPIAGQISLVAGVDVGVKHGMVRAVVAVLNVDDLKPVDQAVFEGPVTFPYVPGLLSFREIPGLLEAFKTLKTWPDLIVTDGQGRAHPRRFGLACHLGVLLDTPAIGVAKKRLTGIHQEPSRLKGGATPLLDPKTEEQIGAVVRTRTDVKPVFVSVGHRVTLSEAIDFTLRLTTEYKLPETTRHAHRLSQIHFVE